MPPITALLVIDMQTFFRSMTFTALPKIQTLLSHFSSFPVPGPIIFTQHGHTKAELAQDPSPNQLVRKWGIDGSIEEGSVEWELLGELGEWVPESLGKVMEGGRKGKGKDGRVKRVKKTTYDAFIGSDLAEGLAEQKVERVVVCGVMTDCCCDTTARSAFNRGYETWLVSDACGSANKRQHEAGLNGFGFAFGEVLKAREVIEKLKSET